MAQNAIVSYPGYLLVLGKRVRFEVHMASGKLGNMQKIFCESAGQAGLYSRRRLSIDKGGLV
jgi:hypothetical protein